MKLQKIRINNFRGLQNISLDIYNLTSLIGKNNCGKSSILKAIELVCSGIKPDLEEFFNRNYEEKIEIEATFDQIEEWERNTAAISGLVYNNQIRLKYVAEVATENEKQRVEINYFAFKQDEVIEGWADNWPDLAENLKVVAREVGISNATGFRSGAAKERVKQRIREEHPELIQFGEAQWNDDSITFGNALQQALPKVILIPAVKNAQDEMKISKTGKSAFSELMNKLVFPLVRQEANYQAITSAISTFKESIHREDGIAGIQQVNAKLSERLKRMINASASIRLSDPELETLITSNIGLRIHDGEHDTPIELQGNGLQRTLIFSLLELVAENDAALNENTRSTILLFEEPELYLHPQMLRKLKQVLITISSTPAWQVVCSTHSPVFIDVAEKPQSLIILSRNPQNKVIRKQITENPFEESVTGLIERDALRATLDFHPTVCEVFFADEVVLVEGDTEMALLKHCRVLLEHCKVDLGRSHDCTIVSCGGKWTIPAIARLLTNFGIAFKVIHDLDRQGKSDEELAAARPIHPFKANERIASQCAADRLFINTDTLEDIWGGGKSDKPHGAIRTASADVENNTVPARLIEMVKFAYAGFMN